MMPVQVSRRVEFDLQEIGDYIARHNPTRARSFVRELRLKIREIGADPYLDRFRPEYTIETRGRIHGNYLILFRIVERTVFVDRVVHGSRDASKLR